MQTCLVTFKFKIMDKNNLEKKVELSKELEMNFDEVAELFSEETLDSMKMMQTVGGSKVMWLDTDICIGGDTILCDSGTNQQYCQKNNMGCLKSNCTNWADCKEKCGCTNIFFCEADTGEDSEDI